jgi:hypothetical protein
LKLIPDLFKELSKRLFVKSKISDTGNLQVFATTTKPFLQLSPDIFSKYQFLPIKSIRSWSSFQKIYTKLPTKSKTRSAVSRSILLQNKVKKVVTKENVPAPKPIFTRSGRLQKEKVHWEQA